MVRCEPVLAVAVYVTDPLPVPLMMPEALAPVRVSQGAFAKTLQVQVEGAVSVTLPVPPAAATVSDESATVAHGVS